TVTNIVISGAFNSRPNASYELEFFSNTECDSLGAGEGEQLLGSGAVSTDSSGNSNFDFTFTTAQAVLGFVAATATDSHGNTSEFSICVRASGPAALPPTITIQPQDQLVPEGGSTTLAVEATGTAPLTYQWSLNGVNIPGANGSTLELTNFQTINSGLYSVTV